ncbi:MAG: N-acetylmuramoyl-L-alanine amidase [Candidatus Edwardsbacteria bacterium]|nr:N-acetylmuramoyl-L-alanine amidase [Candidatus Edwardsbacteria bacterium]
MAQRISNIIIHCSDSVFGDVNEIRKWHLARGWREVGYHFVILNGLIQPNFFLDALDGSIEAGRYINSDSLLDDNEAGAHTLGYNARSIGICLVGKKKFTAKQMNSLLTLVRQLKLRYMIPVKNILGHNETPSGKAEGKTCPNFRVARIREQI